MSLTRLFRWGGEEDFVASFGVNNTLNYRSKCSFITLNVSTFRILSIVDDDNQGLIDENIESKSPVDIISSRSSEM